MQTMTEPTTPPVAATTDPVSVCKVFSILVFVTLTIIGGLAANFAHIRTKDLGFDMTTFGIWLGAAAICLVVGICTSAICRQLQALCRQNAKEPPRR